MFNATEQAMADLIAKRLQKGMVHPGDPSRDIPPSPIVLPFKVAGQPKEYADLINKTVTLLSEAVIHTLVTEGDVELTPKGEVLSLRVAAGDKAGQPNLIPVYCNCDMNNPLVVLSANDPRHIVVNGRSLIGGLSQRSPYCPHDRIDD